MEILSVQTVPIIHSVPSVTTQVPMFYHPHSGDLSFLFRFFALVETSACLPHIISSPVKPSGQNICMM